jgi:hypothetical protein
MTQQSLPYYQAARFKNKTTAGVVYDAVQKLIYLDIDCDLSAYRLKHKKSWHVVVIGEKPSDKLHVDIEAQLTNGTLVTLDADVLFELMDRRQYAIQFGPWVEGHYHTSEE